MFKKVLLVLLILFISINPAFADMKYTQITSTDTNIADTDAPPEIIQGIMANSNKTEIIYIKGNNIRVDNPRFKTSTITMCDKKQMVHLEHDIKKYVISPFNVSKPPGAKNKTHKGQIKTIVTDTKKTEQIGNYNTHKYIINFSISGNPSGLPDINKTEEIWVADIKDQRPVCLPDDYEIPGTSPSENIHKGPGIQGGLVVKKTITADNPFSGDKIKSTLLIKDISTDPIPDSTFKIPEDYTKLSP